VVGSVTAGDPTGAGAPAGWFPPMAADWAPQRWHPPLRPDVVLYTDAELAAGVDELELLREVYGGVLDQSGKLPYAVFGQNGWEYRANEYLNQRDSFFGSAQQYEAYKQVAVAELDADGGKLRNVLDPNVGVRKNLPRWKEGQAPFYAWTRKAYEKELGAGADVPKVINANQSPALRAALKQVRADFKGPFREEGFNPRPIKTTKGYRLGTLSDHALGLAVDINTATNAQIESADWKAILDFVGKTLDTKTRAAKWKSAPEELHTSIKEINDLFVKNLADAIAAKEATGLATDKARAAVFSEDKNLARLSKGFRARWLNGFFDLPWALVKELHEEKLIWGATFDRVDLHHFEL
jgi:hypothetical protein